MPTLGERRDFAPAQVYRAPSSLVPALPPHVPRTIALVESQFPTQGSLRLQVIRSHATLFYPFKLYRLSS